jgi:hypothetical protein
LHNRHLVDLLFQLLVFNLEAEEFLLDLERNHGQKSEVVVVVQLRSADPEAKYFVRKTSDFCFILQPLAHFKQNIHFSDHSKLMFNSAFNVLVGDISGRAMRK